MKRLISLTAAAAISLSIVSSAAAMTNRGTAKERMKARATQLVKKNITRRSARTVRQEKDKADLYRAKYMEHRKAMMKPVSSASSSSSSTASSASTSSSASQ